MSFAVTNSTSNPVPSSFNKGFGETTYSKTVGNGADPVAIRQWLETVAMPAWNAHVNGTQRLSPQEEAQLMEWISWAQQQVGSSNWDPMAAQGQAQAQGATPGMPGATPGQQAQEPNNLMPGPNGNWVANWQDVTINYYSGHPSNSQPTDVWTNKVEINSSAFVSVDVSRGSHPQTGEDVLIVKILDGATGQEKIIYVHNPDDTQVVIKTPNPDKIQVNGNLPNLTTGQFKAGQGVGDQPTEEVDGIPTYKQPNVNLNGYDNESKEVHVLATQSVNIATDPNDKISVAPENYQGEPHIRVTIEHDDGTTDVYHIRKVEGLAISFPNAIKTQFKGNIDTTIKTAQTINGVENSMAITYANQKDAEAEATIAEAARALGMTEAQLRNEPELLALIEDGDFSTEDLAEAKALSGSLGLELTEVLGSSTLMEAIKLDSYSDAKGRLVALANETGTKGNLEALEALLVPETINWMANPATASPPQAWIEFVSTYDKELKQLVGNELLTSQSEAGARARIKALDRLAELYGISQSEYRMDGRRVWYTGETESMVQADGTPGVRRLTTETHFGTSDNRVISGSGNNVVVDLIDDNGNINFNFHDDGNDPDTNNA